MSGPFHPTGRARVSATNPRSHGICQRCGFTYLRQDLVPQFVWAGDKLQDINLYVCKRTCLDIPQQQLRSIIIPPDPVPVYKPFPEVYEIVVPNFMATESSTFAGDDLTTEDGNPLIAEIRDTPIPDPNDPALYP